MPLFTMALNTFKGVRLEARTSVRRLQKYCGSKELSNVAHSHDLVALSLVISHDLLNHFPDLVYKSRFAVVVLNENKSNASK